MHFERQGLQLDRQLPTEVRRESWKAATGKDTMVAELLGGLRRVELKPRTLYSTFLRVSYVHSSTKYGI